MIARIMSLSLFLFALPFAFAQADSRQELNSPEQYIRDGNAYYATGSCEYAQYMFQLVLELEPDNVEATLGKGKAMVCQGAVSAGIKEYQKVIDSHPDNVMAYSLLARAYLQQYTENPQRFPDRLNDALEVLERAERIAGDNAQVLNTKGVILYATEDYNGAKSALERAASLAANTDSGFSLADRAAVHINLGKTYRELGQYELALTAFRRAVTLAPANAEAHNNLGNIHFQLGDCDQAIYELTQAANLDPSSLSAVAQLAISLFECDQVEASIPRFQQALELDGVSLPPLYTYLARAYMGQGQLDEALFNAQKGALIPPTSAESFYWLGRAYEAKGNTKSATDAYNRALELDPNYAPASEALSKLR